MCTLQQRPIGQSQRDGYGAGVETDSANATLIQHDSEFAFVDPNGKVSNRPLRVWETKHSGVVAIVTEPWDAPGMSITNAAEQVVATVHRLYPRAKKLTVIEHYPDDPRWPEDSDARAERFATINHTPGQPGISWTPVERLLLLHTLGLDNYPE